MIKTTNPIYLRFLSFCLSGIVLLSPVIAAADQLDKIHKKIEEQHSQINHIAGAKLEQSLTSDDWVVFDVREQDEFDVSHILGAIRVDPDIDGDTFLREFATVVEGKNVLFYCSVGRRSSELASRVNTPLLTKGSLSVSNLENGIFGWHNEYRPLMSQSTVTDFVHPYNRWWGRLIKRREMIRFDID